ncbi:MAG: Holliday junction resolvase RuvX [Clostridia bacterium]|nr:Holliday junction resolvase RuvX [Clostridia bacterium]
MKNRIMGIDYGDVRTGIAISDLLGITAQGLESINHGESEKKLLNRIAEIIKEYQIEKIVIGYPLNMNNTKGPRAEKTDKFIEKLKNRFGLEVIKMDERLTTVSAHRTMTTLSVSKDRKKNIVDTISAEYILQMYLDRNA